MSYNPTNWVNGQTPISASNLNHIEQGIKAVSDLSDEHESKIADIANNQIPEAYLQQSVDNYIANNQAGLATKTDVNNLDNKLSSDIVDLEEVVKDKIGSILSYNDGYITTGVEVGTVVNIDNITLSSGYKNAIINCVQGDRFSIIGKGGGSPRLYAFLAYDNKLLSVSEAQAIRENPYTIVAPANATKLVVNFATNYNYLLSYEDADFIKMKEQTKLIDLLKYSFEHSNGSVLFKKGYYINTGVDEGTNIDVTPIANDGYAFAIVECKVNDAFEITGKGGNAPRLFAVTDEQFNLLSVSGGNANVSMLKKTISEDNAKYIIFNVDIAYEYSVVNAKNSLDGRINGSIFGRADVIEWGGETTHSIFLSEHSGVFVSNPNYTSVIVKIRRKTASISITANSNHDTKFTFLKSFPIVGNTPDYADGYSTLHTVESGKTEIHSVPRDAEYIYFHKEDLEAGNFLLPQEVLWESGIIKLINSKALPKERHIYIAASNSTDNFKAVADYICTGEHDEVIINKAINSLLYGGTVQLFDGDYYIDGFDHEDNTAIYVDYVGYARTINIIGTTENKAYLSRYGVTIHVTESAMNAMSPNEEYRVFGASSQLVRIEDWPCWPNNCNIENMYIYLNDVSKKIIGIDGRHFGSMFLKQIGVYNKDYFMQRFTHVRASTPCKGSIGVISIGTSGDEMARIGMDTVNVGGLYYGILAKEVDHLIMRTCTTARCSYGYVFEGKVYKTMTMINCCDEGNTHLPKFIGEGHLTCIDFNIERLNPDHIPFDPDGDTEKFAVEETPRGWKGFISFTLQGGACDMYSFWKEGSGLEFNTVNLNNKLSGRIRNEYPEYGNQFLDLNTNKIIIWNGTNWVDCMGEIV